MEARPSTTAPRRLLLRLLVGTIAPTIAALALFGFFAHEVDSTEANQIRHTSDVTCVTVDMRAPGRLCFDAHTRPTKRSPTPIKRTRAGSDK